MAQYPEKFKVVVNRDEASLIALALDYYSSNANILQHVKDRTQQMEVLKQIEALMLQFDSISEDGKIEDKSPIGAVTELIVQDNNPGNVIRGPW